MQAEQARCPVAATVSERMSGAWFRFVHLRNLVYNTCWEDPRLDREALDLGPFDRVLVITSAGCNALDYALEGPEHVYAVDMNARQNALLDLKLAAIRRLDYETFFSMFGRGRVADARDIYEMHLWEVLPPPAQAYWDRHIKFFCGRGWRRSFYFRGTSGTFARLMNGYLDRVARVRDDVEEILGAKTIEEQREIYERNLRDSVWTRWVRWAVGRDMTLSLLGVPRPQRQQVERDYAGGIAKFIEDCVEAVFMRLPLRDNYFWRVYLTGEYTPECCPEYLKAANFERLRNGLADRISTHTSSVTEFLKATETTLTRFVLLDHMDWLGTSGGKWLEEEWQAIVDRAAPRSRIIWRSGGLRTDFVDRLEVRIGETRRQVGEILNYDRALAAQLHPLDRVHTYASFWIANLACA
jgi:S-adenosylmethionine-diacylglycerol 3-amino-3-carboxypropyl transferase